MVEKPQVADARNDIESVLQEQRKFECPEDFRKNANIKGLEEYERIYRESVEHPEKFWAGIANELHWFKKWDKVLEWNHPWAKWFVAGQLNLSYNCLDRHVQTSRKNKAALIWESEPGEVRTLTYQQLHREVKKFANVLKSLGVKKGDRVAIYMGMTPELPVAMLACARIGAPHTVVFGGFSSNALVDRIQDSQAVAVVTQDGSYRRGAEVKLFPAVEEALKSCPSVKHVVVYKRTGSSINMQSGRDHWWQDLMADASDDCPAEPLDAEHPLYILYTSGTTGKPKGVVHTTGGYSVGTYITTKWVFDLKEEDTYWCTADIGWVTGHSYIVYGPLQNGATTLMYEGAPNTPEPDRFWRIIDRHQVNIFYTAPTAIRTFLKWGDEWPKKHKLDSLRLLGTVGEPINPEAWMWYREVIGHNRCPIVDTWWQTETGHIMLSPIPGAIATKPGWSGDPLRACPCRGRRRDHRGALGGSCGCSASPTCAPSRTASGSSGRSSPSGAGPGRSAGWTASSPRPAGRRAARPCRAPLAPDRQVGAGSRLRARACSPARCVVSRCRGCDGSSSSLRRSWAA